MGCKQSYTLCAIKFFWSKLTWMWRDYCWTTWLVDTSAFTASLAANVFPFFSYQGKCPEIAVGCCLWAEEWHSKSCGRGAGKGNMIFCPWKRGLELLWIRCTRIDNLATFFCTLQAMSTYGFEIVQTLIVDIEPDVQVKRAMNEINAGSIWKFL